MISDLDYILYSYKSRTTYEHPVTSHGTTYKGEINYIVYFKIK